MKLFMAEVLLLSMAAASVSCRKRAGVLESVAPSSTQAVKWQRYRTGLRSSHEPAHCEQQDRTRRKIGQAGNYRGCSLQNEHQQTQNANFFWLEQPAFTPSADNLSGY